MMNEIPSSQYTWQYITIQINQLWAPWFFWGKISPNDEKNFKLIKLLWILSFE